MEAIKLKTCTHENLLELDQTQSYTAIANNVMTEVITNPLIAPAARLWILIRFQQSGFYDREYIERRVTWFARKLSVSVSTIQKWQRLLEREGYLEIIEQKYSAKNNKPNRYRACLPKSVIKQIKEKPRVYTEYTKEGSDSNVENIKSKTKGEGGKRASIKPINSNTAINQEGKCKEGSQLINVNVKEIESIFDQSPRWLFDMLPGLKLEIINQTLWITGVHQYAKKIIQEQQGNVIEHLNKAGYDISVIQFNRDDKKPVKNSDRVAKSKSQNKAIATDVSKPKVFSHTRHSVYKRLLKTSINGQLLAPNQAKSLCEEVIYSIENGALKHQPKLMGINIALKLIRENRWNRPVGYTEKGSHQS